MKTCRDVFHRCLVVSLSIVLPLILLLAACAGTSPSEQSGTPSLGITMTPTTAPMPTTQTSCPPAGTARAAVMAPLAPGSHTNRANVVYVEKQQQGSILKRYDITTRSATTIVSLSQASVAEAQVSADGQWVLFVTLFSDHSSLQLVRMDGQGLQTLYCSTGGTQSGIADIEWSPDQKHVAFTEKQNVSLLTVATGAQRVIVRASADLDYVPRTWLDNTRLYLSGLIRGSETPPLLHLYLFDSNSGALQQVLSSPTLCGDFDSSIDGTRLFTSECQFAIPEHTGPSSIRVQPATGGTSQTIYQTPAYAITTLRVASRTTLLFAIENTGVANVDSSHNGLWKINTDGAGLTRLTTSKADEMLMFNLYSRYTWSTVSRDGTTYAVQVRTITPARQIFALLIGSMNGGTPTIVSADAMLAGWTAM
ncbi:MAG: hypothetical protein IMW89_12360 [Ktedonobacteraceae bacterium]|nr:hypothetical protein [Ktedonobacteraceae bacterium]